MTMGGNVGRSAGVTVPARQNSSHGEPRTVSAFAVAETFAIEWADDAGQIHRELVHRIGGVWYRAPNGENYAATLKSVPQSNWMFEKLEAHAKLAGKSDGAGVAAAAIPGQDAVDVVGG